MKMFLTRIGFGSKVVITGDATQKDLAPGAVSGLDVALRVLGRVEEIGISQLTSSDVVRHPLVQRIVKAYEEYEKQQADAGTRPGQQARPGKRGGRQAYEGGRVRQQAHEEGRVRQQAYEGVKGGRQAFAGEEEQKGRAAGSGSRRERRKGKGRQYAGR